MWLPIAPNLSLIFLDVINYLKVETFTPASFPSIITSCTPPGSLTSASFILTACVSVICKPHCALAFKTIPSFIHKIHKILSINNANKNSQTPQTNENMHCYYFETHPFSNFGLEFLFCISSCFLMQQNVIVTDCKLLTCTSNPQTLNFRLSKWSGSMLGNLYMAVNKPVSNIQSPFIKDPHNPGLSLNESGNRLTTALVLFQLIGKLAFCFC